MQQHKTIFSLKDAQDGLRVAFTNGVAERDDEKFDFEIAIREDASTSARLGLKLLCYTQNEDASDEDGLQISFPDAFPVGKLLQRDMLDVMSFAGEQDDITVLLACALEAFLTTRGELTFSRNADGEVTATFRIGTLDSTAVIDEDVEDRLFAPYDIESDEIDTAV